MLKRLSMAGRNINRKSLSWSLGALFLLCSHANAEAVLTIEQLGGDVVATVSGSIDLTGLTFSNTASGGESLMAPQEAIISFAGGTHNNYLGITGPVSFGSGAIAAASSHSGDDFSLEPDNHGIGISTGYVSVTSLFGTASWDSETLSALGVTPGTYTWTWGTGADADSLTLYAGVDPPTEAPEPGSLLLIPAGFAALSGFAVRKHRNQ